jgi:hypothetical protein
MKRLLNLLIAGALVTGSAGVASAQGEGVTGAVKDVGSATKHAAKTTGKATTKTTKKVVKKSAKGTKKGVEKVGDKANPKHW